jgi:putative transcriptional regulator
VSGKSREVYAERIISETVVNNQRLNALPALQGYAIKANRKRLGISQLEFAKLMGVGPRTLQKWENGGRRPAASARVLLLVATVDLTAIRCALVAHGVIEEPAPVLG